MKKTELKEIIIEETYEKIKGKVYWIWRFAGKEDNWRVELTPYKEIPWIRFSGSQKIE